MAAHLSSVSAGLGRGFELQAIAAAVVGGTSLSGGRGTVTGAALAAVLLATIANGLQLTGVDATWFQIIVGASIVGAVAFHQWTVRSDAQARRNGRRPRASLALPRLEEGSPDGQGSASDR
jgi:ribose transport system permease protein